MSQETVAEKKLLSDADQRYFKEATAWDNDRITHLEQSEKRAWWVAGGAGLVAAISVFAVAVLAPLKTTEPFLLRVNNATGAVDIVTTLKNTQETYDEAINKYFVRKYVVARESYMYARAQEDHRIVMLMSASDIGAAYHEAVDKKHPQSPLNLYNNTATLDVDIQSISFLDDHTALVRYIKTLNRTGEKPQITHWQATLPFKFTHTPQKERDRLVNPLGFKATGWRTDPDAVETIQKETSFR